LFQHNEKYIKKNKQLLEEAKKPEKRITKEEQAKAIQNLVNPAQRQRIKSPDSEINTSTNTYMMQSQAGKNNDKYVYEKLKKDVTNFLVTRGIKPVDDEGSNINFEEFNLLLDELGFINLSKMH
jgi:hypothetical protein